MHLNHPQTNHPLKSVEKLSSMKPVPGAKKGWGTGQGWGEGLKECQHLPEGRKQTSPGRTSFLSREPFLLCLLF